MCVANQQGDHGSTAPGDGGGLAVPTDHKAEVPAAGAPSEPDQFTALAPMGAIESCARDALRHLLLDAGR
jgi:hypothetical protein